MDDKFSRIEWGLIVIIARELSWTGLTQQDRDLRIEEAKALLLKAKEKQKKKKVV